MVFNTTVNSILVMLNTIKIINIAKIKIIHYFMDYCWLVRNESLNRDFSTISPKIDTLKISECKNRNGHYIYDDGNTVPSSGQAQHGGGVKQINRRIARTRQS